MMVLLELGCMRLDGRAQALLQAIHCQQIKTLLAAVLLPFTE